MTEVYTDFLGQEVRVGDYVVYATTSAKSPVQKLARVEKISSEQVETFEWRDGKRVSTGTRPNFTVGVKEMKNGRNFTRFDSRKWDPDTGRFIDTPDKVRTTYPTVGNIVRVDLTPDSV